jgi:hypothetical protein
VESQGRLNNGEEIKGGMNPGDCFQPKSIGLCRGFFEVYYFNSETRKCEKFIWSGCGGNENRWASQYNTLQISGKNGQFLCN